MARTFLTVIFLKSGIDKVLDPSATQQYMAAHGIPLTGIFLADGVTTPSEPLANGV
jgi:putative oxidoreductase